MKIELILDALDGCRLWSHGVAEALDRYSKKTAKHASSHSPEQTLLHAAIEKLCFGELTLQSAILNKSTEVISRQDPLIVDAESALLSASQATAGGTSTADMSEYGKASVHWQSEILLARLYLVCGDHKACIEKLESISPELTVTSTHREYWKVFLIMYHVLLGQAYTMIKDFNRALDAFSKNSKYITNNQYIKSNGVNHDAVDQLIWWQEENMFATIQTKLLKGDGTLELMTSYSKTFNTFPASFKTFNRLHILHHLLHQQLNHTPKLEPPLSPSRILSTDHINPLSGLPLSFKFPKSESHPQEIDAQLNLYESLAVTLIPFPRGEDITPMSRMYHEYVQNVYDLYVLNAYSHVPTGDIIQHHVNLIQILYRGTEHTFQSLKLLRYLSYTFLSLILYLGDDASKQDYKEARALFERYFEMFEQLFSEMLASERKKKEDAQISVGSPLAGNDQTIPIIKNVGGETIVDFIGVLVAGSVLELNRFDHSSARLEVALKYINRAAFVLETYRDSILSDYKQIAKVVYQWQGSVFGEYAVEIANSKDRKEYQVLALAALKKSESNGGNKDWRLMYQLAYQLAEVGEIKSAIVTLQSSLTINTSSIPSWNLMALLLSALKNNSHALNACEAGWKEGLDSINFTSDELFSWENIDAGTKEHLLNLKLTELSIITHKNGPKQALDFIHQIFYLFKKMSLPSSSSKSLASPTDSKSAEGQPPSTLPPPLVSLQRPSTEAVVPNSPPLNGLNGHVDSSNLHPGHSRTTSTDSYSRPSSSMQSSPLIHPTTLTVSSGMPYSFRWLDIQVCLWVTWSSLLRVLNRFSEAREALQDAEKIVEDWIRIDESIEDRDSLVFGKENDMDKETDKISEKVEKKRHLFGRRHISNVGLTSMKDASQIGKWGITSQSIRRVLADILFEKCLLDEAEFKESIKTHPPTPFAQYLPEKMPEVDFFGKSDLLKSSRGSGVTISKNSISSLTSGAPIGSSSPHTIPSSTVQNVTDQGAVQSSPTSPDVPNGNSFSTDSPSKFYPSSINGSFRQTREVPTEAFHKLHMNNVSLGDSSTSLHAPSTSPQMVTNFIETMYLVTVLDDDHLPARVYLGHLYKQVGDMAQAEYWYERACKRSKARGSGCGSRGLSTYFGGLTSQWGWESWAGLGRVLKETDRVAAARDCLVFSVQLERVSPLRGLECLRRFQK